MPRPILLGVIAIAVLVPSTLVAGFWSLLGAAWVADALRRGEHTGTALALIAAMAGGWFGLVTAWRLHYRLRRKDLAFDLRMAWCGLASGALVCMGLIATTGGSLLFRAAFLGWPLLAVAFFGAALWRLSRAAAAAP